MKLCGQLRAANINEKGKLFEQYKFGCKQWLLLIFVTANRRKIVTRRGNVSLHIFPNCSME